MLDDGILTKGRNARISGGAVPIRKAGSNNPGLGPLSVSAAENGQRGVKIATLTPLKPIGTAGAISLSNLSVAGTLQMNANGRDLEYGATNIDFEANPVITFTATYTDSAATRNFNCTLNVIDVNDTDPVVVSQVPNFVLRNGTAWAGYDFGAHFSDPLGGTLSFAFSTLPANLTATGDTLNSVTPNATVALATYTLTVTNARSSIVVPFSIEILASTGSNTAPSITTTALNVQLDEGTAPAFVSFLPATPVAVDASIVLTFDQPMQAGAGTITLFSITDNAIHETLSVPADVGTKITISGSTVTLNPANDFGSQKNICVQWSAGALKNLGNTDIAANTSQSLVAFTTVLVAAQAPAPISFTPSDDTIGVAPTAFPTIVFDRTIVSGSGLITLRQNIAGTWSDVETFDVGTEQGTGAGQVEFSGATLRLRPTSSMVAGREYAIRIAGTCIKSSQNVAYGGITNDTAWSFTIAAAFAQPKRVQFNAATRVAIPGTVAPYSTRENFLFASRIEVPLTATTYLLGRQSSTYVRVMTTGAIVIRLMDANGVQRAGVSTATGVITANTPANVFVLVYDTGTNWEYRVVVGNTTVLTGNVASPTAALAIPTFVNGIDATSNGQAWIPAGMWIGQADTIPGTLPVYGDFFSGSNWLDVFTTTATAGFSAIFREAGDQTAWTAQPWVTGGVGDGQAPAVSGDSINGTSGAVAFTSDEAGTTYWTIDQTNGALAGSVIKARVQAATPQAYGSQAATVGANAFTAGMGAVPQGTNYLHLTVEDAAGFFSTDVNRSFTRSGAAVVTSVSYNNLTNELSFTTDLSGTYHVYIDQVSGAVGGASIKSGVGSSAGQARGTGAASVGANTVTINGDALLAGANYIHLTVETATDVTFSVDGNTTFKPDVKYLGEVVVGNSAGTTSVATLTPLGLRADDLVICWGSVASNAQRTAGLTGATGFTDFPDGTVYANDTNDTTIFGQYKKMTSSPETSVTMAACGSSNSPAQLNVRAYRYVDTATPFDIALVKSSGINSLLVDPPSIGPLNYANSLIVIFGAGARANGDSTTYTQGGDLTDFTTSARGSSNFNLKTGHGHKRGVAAAASFDAAAWTGATDSTADSRGTYNCALKRQE